MEVGSVQPRCSWKVPAGDAAQRQGGRSHRKKKQHLNTCLKDKHSAVLPIPLTIYTKAAKIPLRPANKASRRWSLTKAVSEYSKCSTCIKGFRDITQLQKHLLTHAQEQDLQTDQECHLSPREEQLRRKDCQKESDIVAKQRGSHSATSDVTERKSCPPDIKASPLVSKELPLGGTLGPGKPGTSTPVLGKLPIPAGNKVVKVLNLTKDMVKKFAPSLLPPHKSSVLMITTKGSPMDIVNQLGKKVLQSVPVLTISSESSKPTVLVGGKGGPKIDGDTTQKKTMLTIPKSMSNVTLSPTVSQTPTKQATEESLRLPPSPTKSKCDEMSSTRKTYTKSVTECELSFCQVCQLAFTSHERYTDHLVNSHGRTEEDELQCGICSRKFLDCASLMRHNFFCRLFDKDLRCQQCDTVYKTTAELREHMRVHGSDYVWQCNICDDVFKSVSELATHKKDVHASEGEEALKVSVESEFVARSQLGARQAKDRKTGRRRKGSHLCDICGYTTCYSSALSSHLKRHMGIRQFACDLCDKSFVTSTSLIHHRRRHTGEKPYSCPQCPKHFITKSSLSLHLRFHNDVRPFVCDVCGKAFHTSQNMKVHRRRHSVSTDTQAKGKKGGKMKQNKKKTFDDE